MKRTLYILLTLLLIIVLFSAYEKYIFNNFINNPIKGNMNIPINNNAPVKSRNQIEIEAPIDTVWKILTDIKNWTKWQKAVSETIVLGQIEEGTKFNWKAGGLSFESKIHTAKLNSKFGWTGSTIGASAIHNWTFEEKDYKTIVIVEESLQGVFPKLFRSYFQKNLDSGVLTNLNELKREAESRTK
jgi:uncharacterized membrane protein